MPNFRDAKFLKLEVFSEFLCLAPKISTIDVQPLYTAFKCMPPKIAYASRLATEEVWNVQLVEQSQSVMDDIAAQINSRSRHDLHVSRLPQQEQALLGV